MRTRRGFTILEVMFAIVIFAIGLIGTFSGFAIVREKIEHQRHLSVATQAASGWLEQIVILPRASSLLAVGPIHGPRFYSIDGVVVPSTAQHFFELDWFLEKDDPRPPMRGVTTRVRWTSAGITHELKMRTYVD